MNKTNFSLKINVRRVPFFQVLAQETGNAIAWTSQRIKEKSIAESGILDRPIPLPKGKYLSPAPEPGFFPTTSKRLNVHNTQLHMPQFLLCLDDGVVPLDRIPFESERSPTPKPCKDTPTFCEKIHNITMVFVFLFFCLLLLAMETICGNVCQFCVLRGWERGKGLEGRGPGAETEQGRMCCGHRYSPDTH